jgi:quercetin dioxygenase-like cupin family protein
MSSTTSYRWDDVAPEQITDHISRRYITGDDMTVARFALGKGGVVPRHAHDNEQISCVVSGRLEFRFDDRTVVVGPNEVMQIPGAVPHEVAVLEDAVVIDVFHPIRQDWLDRTDTYFTNASTATRSSVA